MGEVGGEMGEEWVQRGMEGSCVLEESSDRRVGDAARLLRMSVERGKEKKGGCWTVCKLIESEKMEGKEKEKEKERGDKEKAEKERMKKETDLLGLEVTTLKREKEEMEKENAEPKKRLAIPFVPPTTSNPFGNITSANPFSSSSPPTHYHPDHTDRNRNQNNTLPARMAQTDRRQGGMHNWPWVGSFC
jgi:hypothetical protein